MSLKRADVSVNMDKKLGAIHTNPVSFRSVSPELDPELFFLPFTLLRSQIKQIYFNKCSPMSLKTNLIVFLENKSSKACCY